MKACSVLSPLVLTVMAIAGPGQAMSAPQVDPALVCAFMFADRFEQPEPITGCNANFDVNVPSTWLDVQVTINGDPPPTSTFEDGEIWLRNFETGDVVYVGKSSTGNGLLGPIRLVNGSYDAVWTLDDGGGQVPVNSAAVVGSFVIEEDQLINVDVPLVTIAGAFTIDGEEPVDSPLSTARIYLRNPSSGDQVVLGELHQGSYLKNIVPGTYDVVYERTQGIVLPANTNAIVDQVTIVYAPDIVQTVDVDLVSGFVSGDVRFDGQVPPDDDEDYGRIWFIDNETGDAIRTGDTRIGGHNARLLAGSYDAYYRAGSTGAVAPVNDNARIASDIDVESGGLHEVDLNIRVVDVEATVTINGQAPPASLLEMGWILLRREATGDQVFLGATHLNGGVLQARVVQGIYDVYWDLVNGGSVVPANRRARLFETGLRPPAAAFDVNIPMVVLEGDIRLNGLPPNLGNGYLELDNRLTGDTVFLGESTDGSYERRMIPGFYDTVYRHDSGNQVPQNSYAIVGESCVSKPEGALELSRDIDLRSRVISGTISLDGQIPPASGFESGHIIFRDPLTGAESLVGETNNGTYSAHLLHGHYEVYYSLDAGGALVPINSHALVGELRVCSGP